MTSHPSRLVNNPSGEGQHDEQRNISLRWRQKPFVICVMGSNPRRDSFQHIWNVLVVLVVMLLFSQSWILRQKPPWNRNHMGELYRQHFEDQQVFWWIEGGRRSETEDGADGWTWMDGLWLLVHKSAPGGGWGEVGGSNAGWRCNMCWSKWFISADGEEDRNINLVSRHWVSRARKNICWPLRFSESCCRLDQQGRSVLCHMSDVIFSKVLTLWHEHLSYIRSSSRPPPFHLVGFHLPYIPAPATHTLGVCVMMAVMSSSLTVLGPAALAWADLKLDRDPELLHDFGNVFLN